MNPFGNIVQKAFYLGMGLASLATEKASSTLSELRIQASKLAEELVERGEMNTDEARKFVDDLVGQAQQGRNPEDGNEKLKDAAAKTPRTIDIEDISDSDPQDSQNPATKSDKNLEELKAKVRSLQTELQNIQQ
jgi:polyhydroxyalkanoate synthesis regulator phasin